MDSCSCVPKQRILDKTSYWRYITMLVWILLLFVDQCSSTPTNPSSLKALIASTLRPPENNIRPNRPFINSPNLTRTTLPLHTTTTTPYIVNEPKAGKNWRVENVCRPEGGVYTYGNNVASLAELHNCTVIEGSLRLLWMLSNVKPENYTAVALPNLYEITDHLVLYRVNGLLKLGDLFPNLRVIRGNQVFYNFGLVLFELMDIESISLPKLRYLGRGVLAYSNPQLCFLDKVDWTKIIPGKPEVKWYENEQEQACRLIEGCRQACEGRNSRDYCWDNTHCQDQGCGNCMVGDYNRGCAPNGKCCHQQCLGGCAFPDSPSDCYVCKTIFYNGTCMEKCPSVNADNETLYEFDARRCVTARECLEVDLSSKLHMGSCILDCPAGSLDHPDIHRPENRYNLSVHVCRECDGKCDKVCLGGTYETIDSTYKLKGCTNISLFLELAFNMNSNITMLRENLGKIRSVNQYVKVVRSHYIESLSFFESLEYIGGERLDMDRYAFYVMDNEVLETVWDINNHASLTIGNNGLMFFARNPMLCSSEIKKFINETRWTNSSISYTSHTKFDLSPKTNGQDGNCRVNTLFLNVTLLPNSPDSVFYNFSRFETNEERLLISYIIYFRPVKDNETVTYYNSRSRRDCDRDKTVSWFIREIPVKEVMEKYYSDVIMFDIQPFQRYAMYVMTYSTDEVNLVGGRSEIKYFKTYPDNPSEPILQSIKPTVHTTDNGTNLGLHIYWRQPASPNGIIQRYIITYRPLPWTDRIKNKDFCDKGVSIPVFRQTTPEPEVKEQVTVASTGKCKCGKAQDESTESLLSNRDDIIYRYTFENYLQNILITKNVEKTSDGRAKRAVNMDDISPTGIGSTTVLTTMLTEKTASAVTDVFDEGNATASLNDTTSTVATTSSTPKPAVKPPSTVYVESGATDVAIFDLEPQMEYLIEIVACQSYNKLRNKTLCSRRDSKKASTLSNPHLDVINSSSVTVVKIQDKEQSTVGLNISWQPPNATNGPILKYSIKYEPVKGTDDQLVTEKCVRPREFEDMNHSYTWMFDKTLHPGVSYHLSVRYQAVGTEGETWTEPVLVKIDAPEDDYPWETTTAAVVVSVVVCLSVVLIAIYIYRRRKPRVPYRCKNESMNQEYMDTDNVYIADEWEVPRNKVKIGVALGQGSFGMVYEGTASELYQTDKKSVRVAIKTVNNTASLAERINFLNEASRMKSFDCHHIVKLLGVVSQGSPVLVIMELMEQGDLRNYLRKHRPDEPDNGGRKPPTLREILQMAAEIADGMAYLADKKFVHRDLAARNCMVAQDMTVKIGDFGMSRDVYYSEYYRKGGKAMLPVRWMAPESLRDGICTSKSDVWSYGIVLYEMATLAAQPYVGFTNEQVIPYVLEGNVMEMPSGCPRRLSELMARCWQYHQKARPTFTQILDILQGDVKKNFFSVSWYYTQRDSDGKSQDSDASIDDDDISDESHPLNRSLHSLHADHDLDSPDDLDPQSDDIMPGLFPYRRPVPTPPTSQSQYDDSANEPMLNGHSFGDSDNDLDSNCNGESTTTASIVPSHTNITDSLHIKDSQPPSYRALVDQSSLSDMNSCNGSANGHIQYNNHMTTAC